MTEAERATAGAGQMRLRTCVEQYANERKAAAHRLLDAVSRKVHATIRVCSRHRPVILRVARGTVAGWECGSVGVQNGSGIRKKVCITSVHVYSTGHSHVDASGVLAAVWRSALSGAMSAPACAPSP